MPQLLSLRSRACEPQLLIPRTTTTEAHVPIASALQQEKTLQWEAHAQQRRRNTAKNNLIKLKKKKRAIVLFYPESSWGEGRERKFKKLNKWKVKVPLEYLELSMKTEILSYFLSLIINLDISWSTINWPFQKQCTQERITLTGLIYQHYLSRFFEF